MKLLTNLKKNVYARIIISIIWGLGLAAIFRKICKGRECIIIKSPNMAEYQNKVYGFGNKCYTFSSQVTNCEDEPDA
jgi:hypothetical protein